MNFPPAIKGLVKFEFDQTITNKHQANTLFVALICFGYENREQCKAVKKRE